MKTVTALAPNGATLSGTAGQGGSTPNKWMLLRAVEEAREPLGLKSTSLNVLRAMISFMSGDQIFSDQDDRHICFASNAAIAKRTHVSVQTVERHISALVELGLIRRVMSANGKRWARRDRLGRVVTATGLSLMPLSERHAEFIQEAQKHTDRVLEFTVLRDKVSAAMARLKEIVANDIAIKELMATVRNALRRKPDANVLGKLLTEISVEISRITQAHTENLRANDHENEGHKEDSLSPKVKKEKPSQIQVSPDQMERSFPHLCAELRFARDQTHCDRLMDDIAEYLRLGQTWFAMKSTHGPALRFMILGYIFQRAESIKSHQAYLISLKTRIDQGDMQPTALLKQNSK
ncbi:MULTISPECIES: helix-turn-helix domain-containing protein [unclassified Ruegeria]|uniref:helix-turn-helix domain-containing protein n=1 Tax=unclassified Ruegeria TaxID=2625375 RepID=UPI0014897965|nr:MULTISPECIES: helix-turn-helix domain-containing protein [unclassified Ruegeria]NOD65831.1 winged helix-turn-helix transcriptional regulator [Ruegeria sp. HKCCD6109]